jgi:hypothetical protein
VRKAAGFRANKLHFPNSATVVFVFVVVLVVVVFVFNDDEEMYNFVLQRPGYLTTNHYVLSL